MATSSIGHVRHVMKHVLELRPSSILDVGIGFGRWGFLCREMLDVFNERHSKDQWKVRIEGIEIYEPYIQEHHRYIYDKIHVGDARTLAGALGRFDLIIIGDMMEHVEKEDGWSLFHSALDAADMGLILNIPLGEDTLRQTGADNEHEDHLSWWELDEFSIYAPDTYVTFLQNGMRHASMFISANGYKYAALLGSAQKALEAGQVQEAVDDYSKAVNLAPSRPEAYLRMSLIFAENGQPDESEKLLSAMLAHNPDHMEGRLALARLQAAAGRGPEALDNAEYVLNKAPEGSPLKAVARKILDGAGQGRTTTG